MEFSKICYQPTRIEYSFSNTVCWKFPANLSERFDNFKNLIVIWKKSIAKNLNFLELLYKKKEKNCVDFLIDEVDVDS